MSAKIIHESEVNAHIYFGLREEVGLVQLYKNKLAEINRVHRVFVLNDRQAAAEAIEILRGKRLFIERPGETNIRVFNDAKRIDINAGERRLLSSFNCRDALNACNSINY